MWPKSYNGCILKSLKVWLLAQWILVINMWCYNSSSNRNQRFPIAYQSWSKFFSITSNIIQILVPPFVSPSATTSMACFQSFPHHSFWAHRTPPNLLSKWPSLFMPTILSVHQTAYFLLHLVSNCLSFKMRSWEPSAQESWYQTAWIWISAHLPSYVG